MPDLAAYSYHQQPRTSVLDWLLRCSVRALVVLDKNRVSSTAVSTSRAIHHRGLDQPAP